MSYRNEYIDFFCKSMDWFLDNSDLRHEFCFLFFCSIWLFFREYSRFTGQQEKGKAISFYPFYHFHQLHRHLDISRVIAAESSPLRIAGSRNQTWKEFTLSALELVAAGVRRMLKTRVTLGNISLVLLNVTKRLIFAMLNDSSSFPMFTQLTVIFSL